MANAPKSRKRVTAHQRRAPDGSAFIKCQDCGAMVVVALSDMHECPARDARQTKKKSRARRTEALGMQDQPRSAYHFFMESFKKGREAEDWVEVDRKGFETWNKMPLREKQYFITQAEKVNSAYDKILQEEMDEMSQVDEEADSSSVGRVDLHYEEPLEYHYSDWDWRKDKGYECFNSCDWFSQSALYY